MKNKLFALYISSVYFNYVASAVLNIQSNNLAFNSELYEEVLDMVLCKEHLDYINSDANLRFQFLDKGIKLPKAITKGNIIEFGSYHECLEISEKTKVGIIDGKYCMIRVPLPQIINLQSSNKFLNELEPEIQNYTFMEKLDLMAIHLENIGIMFGGTLKSRDKNRTNQSDFPFVVTLKLGMCLPKSCKSQDALHSLYLNISSRFEYEEEYCRLSDDKPWTPADTVAVTLLSLIGLITILSTGYDVYSKIIQKKDPNETNTYLIAFSLFTNTRRILTVNHVPGTIECIDGIRAFAMTWVILGHTFLSFSSGGYISNMLEGAAWSTSAKSLWLISAPVTVDTFFTLSGLLVVYTTVGKLTEANLLRNLHLFYLNRLLRLFPVLAFCILLQISVLHRISDGPDWMTVASHVDDCRNYWWTNLLYVQNYVNNTHMCIAHTWYLTVDTQLYFICPLVLYWVLGGKKQAWIGLLAGVIISLTASTVYIFIQKFGLVFASDPEEYLRYNKYYYINTLTRAPPFFIGMVFGYILHIGRPKKFVLSKTAVSLLWISAITISGTVIYTYYYQSIYSGEYQAVANMINAFTRPAWALAIGWMILAGTHGYGGPINWVLSLKELKLLSRVSYAMYIIHYPLMFVYVGSAVSPFRFDIISWVYIFLSHYAISFICGLIITLLVDSPTTICIKRLLKGSNNQPNTKSEMKMDENNKNED